MMTRTRLVAAVCAGGTVLAMLFLLSDSQLTAGVKSKGASAHLKDVQTGNPKFKSIGKISFGPDGLLLVADPKAASVVAIDTGDLGPLVKLKKRIDKVDDVIAASMGAKAGSVKIVDMAVNRKSGTIYLSVHRMSDNQNGIITIDGNGKIDSLNLDKVRYVRMTLSGGENSTVRNISGVEFAKDRVLAAGQCNEEFSSKIYALPLPLTHGQTANIYSAETYHISHRRWETRAPIQTFIPYEEEGKSYIVGAFACTPIAKFPLDDIKSGANVKGISVLELGSGNRPLDMFTYKSSGQRWLVTNTYRFHFRKNLFGPSKWWGVRVNMDYLAAEEVNEKAARRNVKTTSGPEGIEIVDALAGAIEIDKLSDREMVVLRDADGKLNLELAPLP